MDFGQVQGLRLPAQNGQDEERPKRLALRENR